MAILCDGQSFSQSCQFANSAQHLQGLIQLASASEAAWWQAGEASTRNALVCLLHRTEGFACFSISAEDFDDAQGRDDITGAAAAHKVSGQLHLQGARHSAHLLLVSLGQLLQPDTNCCRATMACCLDPDISTA